MKELNFLKPEILSGPACSPDAAEAGHCITCSDEARPVLVVSLDPVTGTALVKPPATESGEDAGGESEIDVSLLEEVAPGDILLVHGGVALTNQTRPTGSQLGGRL